MFFFVTMLACIVLYELDLGPVSSYIGPITIVTCVQE